jgi:hypothetical protein
VFVAWHMIRWSYIEIGVQVKDERVPFEFAFEGTTNEVEATKELVSIGHFRPFQPLD